MDDLIGTLNKAEQEYIHRCQDFAISVIQPLFKQYDINNQFPAEIHKKAREWGILHAGIPKAWGGLGLSHRALALSGMPMAEVCAPTTFTMGFNHGTLRPILQFGTDIQKEKFVKELLAREQYASWCMTEPDISGTALFEIKTTARKTGRTWVISGKKCMIGNGNVAEQFMVLARTFDGDENLGLSIFIVPKDGSVEVSANTEKLGFRCLTTPTIQFHDTSIPLDQVLGEPGQGISILLDSLDYMRCGGGIVILGLIRGVLKDVIPWLEERNVFGGKLIDKSHIQVELGRILAEYCSLKHLLWLCCNRLDEGFSISTEAASLKLLGAELAVKATDRAVQMMGWRGIDDKFPIQKRYRDARQTPIFEGTTEVVAANLLQDFRLNNF